MIQKYVEIEKEIIERYKINIVENSSCRSRTHAHCDGTRRICKWAPKNSLVALFELAHEIGHIMTKTSDMRRCESEFYATVWAIKELAKYDLQVSETELQKWQNYIYRELDRGLRRQGKNYPPREELDLHRALSVDIKTKSVPKVKPVYKVRKML